MLYTCSYSHGFVVHTVIPAYYFKKTQSPRYPSGFLTTMILLVIGIIGSIIYA